MAKAKDYSGAGLMHGRLDTAAGESGQHLPKLNPELYGRDPETVNEGGPGTVPTHALTQDPTANEVLGSGVKDIQTIDPMDHTQVGNPVVPGREGSNDVATYEANAEVNPTVPGNAEAQVDEDGNYVSNIPPASMPDGTINTASVSTEVPGVNEDGSLDETEVDASATVSEQAVGEPTGATPAEALSEDDAKAAIDKEGNADHIQGLLAARGLAHTKTKAEAVDIEYQARALEGKTNEDLLALLPNGGEGHKSATKAELITLVLTPADEPEA